MFLRTIYFLWKSFHKTNKNCLERDFKIVNKHLFHEKIEITLAFQLHLLACWQICCLQGLRSKEGLGTVNLKACPTRHILGSLLLSICLTTLQSQFCNSAGL